MRKPLLTLLALCLLVACNRGLAPREVVVYTSVDQTHAEPVLRAFEEESGIRVKAVYDVEATKTVGLVQRLLAERDRPQADVFWSGEFVQTMHLMEEGVLAQGDYAAAGLPEGYVDPEGYWAAFGGRGRVILINTDLVTPETAPDSILDLLSESFPPEQVGLANPLFGTTSTEAAALHALWGKDAAQDFYSGLVRRGVQVLDGNSVVRDRVASGQLAWGLTDTDDACGAIQRGAPVQVIFPDQNGFGSLLIPNTVALIAGGPHPAEGQALADFLLSARTEAQLVELDWIAFPTHELPEGVAPDCYAGVQVHGMAVGFEEIFAALAPSQTALKELFVQ